MIRQTWFEHGTTFGFHYRFGCRGDGIAMHSHPPELAHNLLLLRGSVRVTDKAGAHQEYHAVRIVDRLPEWHEIVALEDGSETLHVVFRGKPAGYAELPASEHDVTVPKQRLEYPLAEV